MNFKGGIHRLRDVKHSFLVSLLIQAKALAGSRLRFLEAFRPFRSVKNALGSYRRKDLKIVDAGELPDPPEELVEAIGDMYRRGNFRLSRMLDIDPAKYGYDVEGVVCER